MPTEEPRGQYDPNRQDVGLTEPDPHKNPAGHVLHIETVAVPDVEENVPAGQLTIEVSVVTSPQKVP
jgi:hypothetical protein